MRRVLCAVLAVTLGTTIAAAQNTTIIKERKEHFKKMGDTAKPANAMFKGEADFDLAAVQAALKVMQEKAAILPTLFPDDAKTGGETEALPVIWEKKADFEARFKKLGESAKAAEAAIMDEITFADTWKSVMGNCSGCHKEFRKPKS
ncbi:c-type cytochrome [Hyphomicrobium zavarzinii]|uniref:c-type cytochrome n=1 Tax=Hyphomicrobium zavarzinii TaxID=48292 RepID=UPI000360F40B|nr:cytochrome c [Hyphomicrobium zavarzinii]